MCEDLEDLFILIGKNTISSFKYLSSFVLLCLSTALRAIPFDQSSLFPLVGAGLND